MSFQFALYYNIVCFILQEDESEFGASMIDDPGTPEHIPDVEEKKVILASAMEIEGKKKKSEFFMMTRDFG